MAGKKPAKPIANQSKEVNKALVGKPVKYMAPTKNAALFECPTCHRTLAKGIIFEDNSTYYCRRSCIPQKQTV